MKYLPFLALVAIVAAIVAARAGDGDDEPKAKPSAPAAQIPREPIEHLRELQRIADRTGGTRAAGTAGDRASARYVARRLRRSGFKVRLEPFRIDFFEESGRPELELGGERLEGASTPQYSRAGEAGGPVREVDPRPAGVTGERDAGCRDSDFRGLPRGAIALIERGTCRLGIKVRNAAQAGAAGAVVFNDGRPGRSGDIEGTLGKPASPIPALFATHAAGGRLAGAAGQRVRMQVKTESGKRTTHNVIAELPGRSREVAMAGAHIDSVAEGPGINDNGSGVSALLAAGEKLAARKRPPRRTVRLAFWGAEELGLIGSRRYVRALSASERRRLVGYLNLDMVGSRNAGRFVYSGGGRGSEALAAIARNEVRERGDRPRRRDLGGGSDHAPFVRAGIPIVGFFSGASRRYDPCYHRRCDTLAGVNRGALRELSGAAADTLTAMAAGAPAKR